MLKSNRFMQIIRENRKIGVRTNKIREDFWLSTRILLRMVYFAKVPIYTYKY